MHEVIVSACKILIENSKGDLGRPRLRWEDNVKNNLKEIG
jgi:hypothetical protein